ncbi:unnamed protein product [Schistosoma mattheei]|uniref:Uncharacterized protein n=1 Tax=Schistosoma mattheei TaxID=31246 RepID=A0A183P5W6_9TREM|nr:unnamed protein product [Schistosoma mattheei]
MNKSSGTVDLHINEELIGLHVIQLYSHLSYEPPPFCVWCCAAMLFPKTPDGNFVENTSNNLSLPSDWQNQLEILITVGDDLFLRLDDSSRYKPHLHKYLNEARRVTDKIQDFRLRFLKLLASGRKINRYLNEKWFTAKSDILKELQYLAFDIVEQLPEVLLDKVSYTLLSSI